MERVISDWKHDADGTVPQYPVLLKKLIIGSDYSLS